MCSKVNLFSTQLTETVLQLEKGFDTPPPSPPPKNNNNKHTHTTTTEEERKMVGSTCPATDYTFSWGPSCGQSPQCSKCPTSPAPSAAVCGGPADRWSSGCPARLSCKTTAHLCHPATCGGLKTASQSHYSAACGGLKTTSQSHYHTACGGLKTTSQSHYPDACGGLKTASQSHYPDACGGLKTASVTLPHCLWGSENNITVTFQALLPGALPPNCGVIGYWLLYWRDTCYLHTSVYQNHPNKGTFQNSSPFSSKIHKTNPYKSTCNLNWFNKYISNEKI